jgi:hypothetical protein
MICTALWNLTTSFFFQGPIVKTALNIWKTKIGIEYYPGTRNGRKKAAAVFIIAQ